MSVYSFFLLFSPSLKLKTKIQKSTNKYSNRHIGHYTMWPAATIKQEKENSQEIEPALFSSTNSVISKFKKAS